MHSCLQQGGGATVAASAAALSALDEAQKALRLIESRLSGNIETAREYRPRVAQVPMAVPGQVDSLIRIATDPLNLAAMYVGWAPYL